VKEFIAFSGGVESSTMCVLWADKAQPVFTDAGWEHREMEARLDMMGARLSEIHGKPIEVLRVKPKNMEGTKADTLPDYIRARKFMPNPMARFCTRLGKIEPMDAFLSTQGDCVLYIGLNADEEDSRTGNYCECKNVTYRYPLIEAGYSRADCEALLAAHDLKPNFPPYMRRGGCKGCFFKRKYEYEAMALYAPDEALEVAELEEAIQDKRGSYYHIHPDIPNMRQFILDVQSGQLFTKEEMYSKQPDTMTTACGVFCHR
jgi:3'-phosphoadenosine 5'-phosphosulfate sulfotransferase (PAPS reductase)/FAD synthetase